MTEFKKPDNLEEILMDSPMNLDQAEDRSLEQYIRCFRVEVINLREEVESAQRQTVGLKLLVGLLTFVVGVGASWMVFQLNASTQNVQLATDSVQETRYNQRIASLEQKITRIQEDVPENLVTRLEQSELDLNKVQAQLNALQHQRPSLSGGSDSQAQSSLTQSSEQNNETRPSSETEDLSQSDSVQPVPKRSDVEP